MFTFFKRTIFFIFLTLFFYVIMVPLWTHYIPFKAAHKNVNYKKGTYGHMNTRLQEAQNYEQVDVLFIGSSHAYRGFDTRVFGQHGIKSFNLGSSNQTPLQTLGLLKKYVKILKPKVVVYEVLPTTFENDGVESSHDIIANDDSNLGYLKMVLRVNHLKIYNAFLYDTFLECFDINQEFKEPLIVGYDTYISGGFVEKNKDFQMVRNSPSSSRDVVFLKRQKRSFEKIVDLLADQKVKLLLVQAPVTKQAYSGIANRVQIDQYFKEKSSYINFNYIMDLDNENDFYDSHHLSQSGVVKFNLELIKNLKGTDNW